MTSIDRLLAAFRARVPIRAGSLLVTTFGDAVVPRGGALALNSLVAIARPFGIADGLVRTALSRLVAEGWFERERQGRRSFYRLTEHGQQESARASTRVYGPRPAGWSGEFGLVLLEGDGGRDSLRSALVGGGYGAIGTTVLVAPFASDRPPGTISLVARSRDLESARRLAERAWPIGEADRRYGEFLDLYGSLPDALRPAALRDVDALALRLLLVHDYRRAVLRDPGLPPELCPVDWHGERARALVASCYRVLLPASERWLDEHGEGAAGPLPPASDMLARRFAAGGPDRWPDGT